MPALATGTSSLFDTKQQQQQPGQLEKEKSIFGGATTSLSTGGLLGSSAKVADTKSSSTGGANVLGGEATTSKLIPPSTGSLTEKKPSILFTPAAGSETEKKTAEPAPKTQVGGGLFANLATESKPSIGQKEEEKKPAAASTENNPTAFTGFSDASALPKSDLFKPTGATSSFITATQDSAADKKEEKKSEAFSGLKLTTPPLDLSKQPATTAAKDQTEQISTSSAPKTADKPGDQTATPTTPA